MISKMTDVCVYVLDQDRAFDFYTNKLGFQVKADVPIGPGMRWLTVTPPEQPDLEISLFPVVEGKIFTAETVRTMTDLIGKGTFGPGIFGCSDIFATYEELKAKGVEFMKPPTREFYGTEACRFFSTTTTG